jgi:hypothetical protein
VERGKNRPAIVGKESAIVSFHHLNLFQLIVVPVVAALFLRNVYALRNGRHRGMNLVGAMVWLAAGVTVLWPGTTMSTAKALGIGRGADLILYLFVVLVLVVAFYFYNRMMQLDASLTLIVRQLALRDTAALNAPNPEIISQTTSRSSNQKTPLLSRNEHENAVKLPA